MEIIENMEYCKQNLQEEDCKKYLKKGRRYKRKVIDENTEEN
jgi:hypothetical protein